ncbi:MAG: hypothetical protein ACXIUQ_19490 [Cecembia sp.]
MEIEKIGSLHGNKVIWRYMSLEKFIDLILNKSIFFANTSRMEDRFEMEIPLFSLEEKKKYYLSRGMDSNKVTSVLDKEVLIAKKFKENTYVNCWSRNDAESYALWKIYLGGSSNGVAIKSTVSKLTHSLGKIDYSNFPGFDFSKSDFELVNQEFEIDTLKIGEVKYQNQIDLKNLNKSTLAITKKEFYDYEKEIRVFATSKNQYLDPSTEEYRKGIINGFSIPIDLDKLVDCIVLSPYSTPWFKENLKNLINTLNKSLSEKIIDSEIGINN